MIQKMGAKMATDPNLSFEETPLDWKWLMAIGVILALGGLAAFAFPFVATLAVTTMAGVAFLIAGALQTWMGFTQSKNDAPMRIAQGLLGLALIVLGVFLLADPLTGTVSLTVAVGVLFLTFGILRTIIALRLRGRPGRGWALASALVSAALGLLILLGLPGSAASILGILLAVDLVMSGAAAIVLALRFREG